METREYIDSGVLELYVYGLLDDDQNAEVAKMARDHKEVHNEIVSIEKAIVNLSTSFSPYLSADNFEKVKKRLELTHPDVPATEKQRRTNWAAWTGWVVAILALAGAGYLYMQLNQANADVVNAKIGNKKLRDTINVLGNRTKAAESAFAIVRDNNNTVIALAGQVSAPDAAAKIYWNRETQMVYLDASGLPEPPEGQVYQVWSFKFSPQPPPASLGLLENFSGNEQKMFNMSNASDADGFGITLEPAGGSQTPTMDRLYVFGKM